MRPRLATCLALSTLLLAVLPAHADDAATEQARPLFDAGKEAYDAGNFPAAIQAFEAAYKIAPRPGIVFSMAQAHRRQYYLDKRPDHLRDAIKYYRDYTNLVAQGGRRAEAAQALAELEPVAERLEKTPDASRPEVKPETRLMILSKIHGATIALDGGKVEPMPLFSVVKSGKHTLHLSADGYFPEDREVEAREGLVVTLDIPLREMPGRITITTIEGAQASIDGRTLGVTPLPRPVEVTAGHHLLAVTKSGYKSFSEELDLERGQTKAPLVKLERTGQRVASYVLLGGGAVSVISAAVLGTIAGGKQRTAEEIAASASTKGARPATELTTYNDAKSARNDLRGLSGVAAGAGLLLGGTGLLLYLFDQPVLGTPRYRPEEKGKTPTPRDTPLELTAGATLGPGLYGGSLTGRF